MVETPVFERQWGRVINDFKKQPEAA